MRLAGIDLNLLTSLDALLEERNVTHAARRLGVTQPAVSHSLRRLRDLLSDPILVRTKQGMTATPRALELRPAVRAVLDAAALVLQPGPGFDPARAERTFRMSMADQVSFMVLPRLLQRLAREAPGVRIEVTPTQADSVADQLDLAIGVFRDEPAGTHTEELWHEEFVCVLRKGSAGARGTLHRKRYLALSHLLVAPRGTPGGPLDDLLASAGERRHIALTVPHFLVAPHVVATSDLVWTAAARFARAFGDQLPLVFRPLPFRFGGYTVAMRWHARLDRDPGLAWLRAVLRDVAPR